LFTFASALSLVLCVVTCILWVRSLGHFERIDVRYARWPRADEAYTGYLGISWYANTLRVELIRVPFAPAYFHRGLPMVSLPWHLQQYPPGVRWEFLGNGVTRVMNGYPPGFDFAHTPYTTDGVTGDRLALAVRPWLPALLTAVLPAIWLYKRLKARRAGRREGFCPHCGYDLRATPDRCPECGGVPTAKAGVA
jgi:hypothetical protein